MKKLNFVICAITTAVLCLTTAAFGQVLKVEPEKPKWGDTLKITYDPDASDAAYTLGQSLSIRIGQRKIEDLNSRSSINQTVPMVKNGNVLTCEVKVVPNIISINLNLMHRDEPDLKSTQLLMVYGANGQPVRGACLTQAIGKDYQKWVEKELTLYPDNYGAYGVKWLAARRVDRPNLKTIIESDINQITLQKNGDHVDWLHSLVYGYLFLGQEEKSREILRKMVARYPDAYQTGDSLGKYEYESTAQRFTDAGMQEVNQMALSIMERRPESDVARALAAGFSKDNSQPLDVPELVLRKWIADDPGKLRPYFDLALALSVRDRNPDQVSLLSEKALDLLLQGKLQEEGFGNRIVERQYLPAIYFLNAKANFKLGKYAQALSAIKAVQAFDTNQSQAEYLFLEGNIWEKAGMITKAEQVYLTALQLGSKDAETKLKSLYLQDGGIEENFGKWLSKHISGTAISASKPPVKKNFPDFKVATLAGKKYELTKLRGRVVVLNFWFINCGPCRAEIPELNKLVKEYEGRNVVFLAATYDDSESVKTFLKDWTFNYEIIPDAQDWIDELGGVAFPTHFIINEKGEVELRLVGNDDKNISQIRSVLARLVQAN